jgi:two-component system chemotaxis sensor kinase CheA
VDLAEGISQEDIKLFLVEAGEQLQLLDEDIVKLERDAGNTKLLEEIFRAAYTLRGSSVMLGHNRMSQLAHALERVLDKVRKGTLKVTSNVVDALLNGLDILRVLKEELLTNNESAADVPGVISRLDAIIGIEKIQPQNDIQTTRSQTEAPNLPKPDEGRFSGRVSYQVRVALNKD